MKSEMEPGANPYASGFIQPTELLLAPLIFNVSGQENLESIPQRPAILAFFPHTGHLDSLALHRAIPKKLRPYIVYPAPIDYWYAGWQGRARQLLIKSLGMQVIPMSRKDAGLKDILKGMQSAKGLLEQGVSIGISPEGTRTELPLSERHFHVGVAYLSLETNAPIIPVRLKGLEGIMPKGQIYPRFFPEHKRRQVEVIFGPALDMDAYNLSGPRSVQREFITQELRRVLLAMG
jgi:1-acyl-sn-glycerol-3-phosphate acyltransferase